MIKTVLIANLGGDAVVNNVNGKNAINFSVAHSEKYKDAQGVQHEKTLWVRCTQWAEKTGIVPYLKKGTQVYVEGMPEVAVYQDKQGKWQAEFKLRVSQIQLLGSKNENSGGNSTQNSSGGHFQQQGNPSGSYVDPNNVTEPMDDLPF